MSYAFHLKKKKPTVLWGWNHNVTNVTFPICIPKYHPCSIKW